MDWSLRPASQRRKVVALVSKFDHCLGHLLYASRIGKRSPHDRTRAGRRTCRRIDRAQTQKGLIQCTRRACRDQRDRKSVVWGKRVAVRVDLGGRRYIKKK